MQNYSRDKDTTHVHPVEDDCFTPFRMFTMGMFAMAFGMMVAIFIGWFQIPYQARVAIGSALHGSPELNNTLMNATEFNETLAKVIEFEDFLNIVINRPTDDESIRLKLVDVWEHKWKGHNQEFDIAMNHFVRMQDGTCSPYFYHLFSDFKYCGPHSIFDVLLTRNDFCWKIFRHDLTAKELCEIEEKYPHLTNPNFFS